MGRNKLKNIPIGTEVILDAKYDGLYIDWIVVHKNTEDSKIYPKNSVLLMTKKIVTIKAFDGKENNVRHCYNSELEFGSNDWGESCIRKWLNTLAECNWQFRESSPPYPENVVYNPYDTELGFLTLFSNEVLAEMLPVTIPYVKENSVRRESKDLVFLPSKTELGIRCKNKEGECFDYFKGIKKRKRRIANPVPKAIRRLDDKFRQDFQNCNEFNPWNYMLRSIDEDSKINFCRNSTITARGKLGSSFSFTGWSGVRPVICLADDAEGDALD